MTHISKTNIILQLELYFSILVFQIDEKMMSHETMSFDTKMDYKVFVFFYKVFIGLFSNLKTIYLQSFCKISVVAFAMNRSFVVIPSVVRILFTIDNRPLNLLTSSSRPSNRTFPKL